VKVKKDKINGKWWHIQGKREMCTVLYLENLQERDHLEDLGVEGRYYEIGS
jgi:hypothetical protein